MPSLKLFEGEYKSVSLVTVKQLCMELADVC